MNVQQVKEWVRWAWSIGATACPHHKGWIPPIPSDVERDAGPLRSNLELQLLAEVIVRASEGQTHAEILEWVQRIVDPPPNSGGATSISEYTRKNDGNRTIESLNHDWKNPIGAYLYGPHWLFASTWLHLNEDELDSYLTSEAQKDATHVVVALSTGHRPHFNEAPFNFLESQRTKDRARDRLQYIINAGKSPWVYLCSQEYFVQMLASDHTAFLRYAEEAIETVSDLCSHATPFRELGDIYGGSQLKERRQIYRAMRKGAKRVALAVHERALEQIPLNDLEGIEGRTVSALQTGFHVKTKGAKYTEGGHNYSGSIEFALDNARRMNSYQRQGRLDDHCSGVFEHSIPNTGTDTRPAFTKYHRSLEEAKRYGMELIHAGVAFDMSGLGAA
jgi:hypothetical protein